LGAGLVALKKAHGGSRSGRLASRSAGLQERHGSGAAGVHGRVGGSGQAHEARLGFTWVRRSFQCVRACKAPFIWQNFWGEIFVAFLLLFDKIYLIID
jgi:hypothetical protein